MSTVVASALAAGAWTLAACGNEVAGGAIYPSLDVRAVSPPLVLPGTRLRVTVGGLLDASVASYRVRLVGELRAAAAIPVDVAIAATVDGDALVASLGDLLAPAGEGTFTGRLEVDRDTADPAGDATAARPLSLEVRARLAPAISALEATELYLGDRIVLAGAGALLPGEGTTLARFDGVFTDDRGARAIDALFVPADAVEADGHLAADRDRVAFALTPDLFGLGPGSFRGDVRWVDVHRDGTEATSGPIAVEGLPLRAPFITGLAPLRASRGQIVTITGRGLLPTDGLLGTATLFLLDGVFTPRRGLPTSFEGAHAIAVYADSLDGNTAAHAVLRTELDADGRPTGLGATPGRFVGRLRPLVLAGPDAIEGASIPLEFEVGNPKQMVHVRLLPGFSEALRRFGLLAERGAVTARILEVLARDYAGVNIAFSFDPPDGFAEYEVVEVGGKDPNGTGLLGLDNTSGKDVGNLRFDDVIGGFNADTSAASFAAYGGIFAEELFAFSPTRGGGDLASPRFDDIFRAVAPELGGRPAEAGEGDVFDERGVAVRKASRVLGNLLGSTIAHEVGHSLGLTALEGRYHNDGDTPDAIMDAGQFRPFAERAEIDGQGPEAFEPFNRDYLESILPADE